MAKTVNPYWKRILFWLSVALAILVGALFFSCNPAQRLIRKEDKAYGITVSTPRTFSQAGALWLQIHPCVVLTKDSIVTKHDTITVPSTPKLIPFKVTEYKTKTLDTIIDNVSLYIDSNGITVKNLNEKEVTTHTIYQTKIDQTRVDNLIDSLNQSKRESTTKDGIIQTLREQLSETKKHNTNLWWLIVAISVTAVLSHVLRSYIPSIKIPKL